jgi:DNA-binding NarL/FixJ family response regulator
MDIIHRHGPGLCRTCPSRSFCAVLCDRAEVYADQDYVLQRELTIGLPMAECKEEMITDDDEPDYTPMQKNIVRLISRGKNINYICEVIGITKDSYYHHISRIRKKLT